MRNQHFAALAVGELLCDSVASLMPIICGRRLFGPTAGWSHIIKETFMQRLSTYRRGITAMIVRGVAAALTLTLAGFAVADPPMRVARLGYLSGGVTFSPAGEKDWVSGTLNRPLITGDRLWADNNGRAELQIGSAVVRLSASTLFTLTNLDDRIAQMHLQQGTLLLRVRRMDRNQVVEVDTPNLAFVINQPGEYRITVNATADSTEVITRSGRANVYDADASYSVGSGRGYRFFGAGLREYDVVAIARPDGFDRWAQGRDRGYDVSTSARYVSRDVIGYQDLDQYGRWSSTPEYGNVWMPTRVATNWAPYRDGHWSWIEPWGWTWIDDQPWGFTVSHYGRWTNTPRGWGWVPGPIAARPVYAPALVAFIGGNNFRVSASSGNVGALGWFPLAPREVYRPAYAVSRDYFTNVNVSNTVINNTIIVNNYDNRNASDGNSAVYANRSVVGAVVTVPTAAFVQSLPVARAQLQVSEAALMQAPVNTLAVVAPQRVSVLGAAQQQQTPPLVVERRVVAQSMPPAAAVGFAVRERALIATPGKPLEAAALAALQPPAQSAVLVRPGSVAPALPSSPAAQPRTEIVQPRAMGPATAAPPSPPPPPQELSDRRAIAGQPAVAMPAARDPNPVVPPPVQMPPVARPASPALPAAQEPVRPGNRGAEERGQPNGMQPSRGNTAAPVQVPPAAFPSQPQPPQPVAPAPAAQLPGQRGPGAVPPQLQPAEPRNKPREQREVPTNQPPIQVVPAAPATVAPAVVQPARPPVAVAPAIVQPPRSTDTVAPAVVQQARPPVAAVPGVVQPLRPPVAAPVERAPVERAPTEAQRGRPERPEGAKPVPAVPATPATTTPAARPPEPINAVSPPSKPEEGEQKPRVLAQRKDDKRGEKKDEKSDQNDDEKKRK